MKTLKQIAHEKEYDLYNSHGFTYHVNTKNRSFIRVFKELYNKKVVNNKFHLILLDPTLADVDPHDPNISKENQAKVITEIKRNPYYYLREVIKVPTPGGNLPFDLHRGNLAIIFCIFNNLDFLVELPRQRYKTVSIICALSYLFYFGSKSSTMLWSNKEGSNVKAMVGVFKGVIDVLPEYVKESILDPLDTNNVETISSTKTKNKLLTANPPNTPDLADKRGRGFSTPILWIDELNASSN